MTDAWAADRRPKQQMNVTATSNGSDRARSIDEHSNAHGSDMDSDADDSNTLE